MSKKLNNMNRKSFINFLIIDAITCLILSVFLGWGISLKCRPNENEKVDIIYCCYGYDSNSGKLPKLLKQNCPDYIREVNINYVNLELSTLDFNNQLIAYMDYVDLFVLPESLISSKLPHLRTSFDKDVFKSTIGIPPIDKWYEENNETLGFCVFNKDNNEGYMKSYFSYLCDGKDAENFYAFFRKDSPQGGIITGGEYNASYNVIREMFKL